MGRKVTVYEIMHTVGFPVLIVRLEAKRLSANNEAEKYKGIIKIVINIIIEK